MFTQQQMYSKYNGKQDFIDYVCLFLEQWKPTHVFMETIPFSVQTNCTF